MTSNNFYNTLAVDDFSKKLRLRLFVGANYGKNEAGHTSRKRAFIEVRHYNRNYDSYTACNRKII